MPGDQATLARIVELLGQPADCAAKIRIFHPAGGRPTRFGRDRRRRARPLESGTVLVFSASSIRREACPRCRHRSSEPRPDLRRPRARAACPNKPMGIQVEPKRGKRDCQSIQKACSPAAHRDGRTAPSMCTQRTVRPDRGQRPQLAIDVRHRPASPKFEHAHRFHLVRSGVERRSAIESRLAFASLPAIRAQRIARRGGSVALMAAMSAVAGLAMLLTFASIVQRWMQVGQAAVSASLANGVKAPAAIAASASVPDAPAPAGLVGRPIRIDAGQPITRLSVDLAAIERARVRSRRRLTVAGCLSSGRAALVTPIISASRRTAGSRLRASWCRRTPGGNRPPARLPDTA